MTDPFEELRRRFAERCRSDRETLAGLSPTDAEFAAAVHRLAGAGGSFGFPALSTAASAIEFRLQQGLAPSPAELSALTRALEEVIGGLRPGAAASGPDGRRDDQPVRR